MQGVGKWMSVTVTCAVCTAVHREQSLGVQLEVVAGISGARERSAVFKKQKPAMRFQMLVSAASNQSQEIPERLFEAQQQTGSIFPHRTRHTANKTSFLSPSSKALKPPFNVKDRLKPLPPRYVLGA